MRKTSKRSWVAMVVALPLAGGAAWRAEALENGSASFTSIAGRSVQASSPAGTNPARPSMAEMTNGESQPGEPGEECLAATLCSIKERVRWRRPAWDTSYCHSIAAAVLKAAERHRVPAALLVAIMINESTMDERAVRTTMRDGAIYAKDGGLMGIRCVLNDKERCTNGHVRGRLWTDVLDPLNNIDIGASELAYWRDEGGVRMVVDDNGVRRKYVKCTHRDHAYWAHYNHGLVYIDHGTPRHYPHRVAVLYYALLRVMGLDTDALMRMRLTMVDPGKPRRSADKPLEQRYAALSRTILKTAGACTDRAGVQAFHSSAAAEDAQPARHEVAARRQLAGANQ